MDIRTAKRFWVKKQDYIGKKAVAKDKMPFTIKDIEFRPNFHRDSVIFTSTNDCEYEHSEVKRVCCGEADKDNTSTD